MKVIVVGAGTAGPALAIGLKRAGHDVVIYDKFTAEVYTSTNSVWFNETGGSVGIATNGLRVLESLGIREEVTQNSIPVFGATFHKMDGSSPVTQHGASDSMPGAQIWRVSLNRIMLTRCQQEGIKTFISKKLVGITDVGDSVVCTFADGTTDSADLVVGADGTHSVIRRLIFGEDKIAVPTGEVGWVGRTDLGQGTGVNAVNDIPICLYADRRKRTTVMVSRTRQDQICWNVSDFNTATEATADWRPSPDLPSDIETLGTLVDSWGAPKHVTDLIRASNSIAPYAIYDLDDLPSYHNGRRVVLIGDAAHAMRPNLGVGLSMGLEDAGTLIELFAEFPDPKDFDVVFKAYDALRLKRTQGVAAKARKVSEMSYSSSEFAANFAHMTMRFAFFVMRYIDMMGPIENYDYKTETANFIAKLKSEK
ncbi:hypothetical protein HDU84_003812 [Entophlyctis sp. JEL0112]|nr:hypothetical protein HDU84_003812 [Entophlyctis sp. JEL0112]